MFRQLSIGMLGVLAFQVGWAIEPEDSPLDLSTYVTARSLVHKNYVDPKKLNEDAILLASMRGMIWNVDPLGECWTEDTYREVQQWKKFSREELGLRWRTDPRQPVVRNVIAKSSAEKAGIKIGDFLWKVNGKEVTQGIGISELNRICSGPSGQGVVLQFVNTRKELAMPLTLKVGQLTEDLKAEMKQGFGYFRVGVGNISPDEIRRQIKSLRPASLKGLMLDLRGTSDLSEESAMVLAGLLLSPDQLTLTTRTTSKGQRADVVAAKETECFPNLETSVIVDRSTSGMAEVIAAALADRRRSVIIGTQTQGFAPYQVDLTLKNGMVCRLTNGYYERKDRTLIQGNGVEPMVRVDESGPVDTEAKTDSEKDLYVSRTLALMDAVDKVRK